MDLEGKTRVWVHINLVILVKWFNLSDSSSHFQTGGNHSAYLKMLWWMYQLIGVVQWAQGLVHTKGLKNRAKHHYHFFSLSSQPQHTYLQICSFIIHSFSYNSFWALLPFAVWLLLLETLFSTSSPATLIHQGLFRDLLRSIPSSYGQIVTPSYGSHHALKLS